MSKVSDYVDNLLSRLRNGEVASLARAISLVDSHADVGNALHHAVRPFTGQAEVIGITGPPGAGKSTLINALITELRGQDKRVAVVAVDPSSPISGGSVLGDRTRMGEHTDDPGVFIRSLSARGHLGGLSASVLRVVDLIDAAGWDVVILETVGAGQSETEVAEVADINVVINAPGLGDDVQAIKAGILEIADVLVVNKADSPLAQRTERQLKAMLQLRREESQQVPVVSTIATAGSGIEELVSAIGSQSQSKFNASKSERLLDRTRRLLAQQAAEQLKCWLQGDTSPESASIITAVIEGNCDNEKAITDLIRIRYGAIL
ncbi:methylmalonyl Co-A mutase-associated GTPase MeaB [Pseudomaricurvus alkylphenolicus]|uniref:methylmalonyl Co-A mutase-associated GTPase MeaB n=1 Tax=Pseudomaricurvus alkylphenolicus TaxID=1306991 RepID=UPI0014202A21|nr:methylmalonyl Co-A mutase-associated GTPase MeaB [Pseudomaricurvus alkylphenolicus]NIB40667.1 methylmalonyl Co-A mutase-associated GTPase MeaB [Pseudomaricurvus alkylphenolicus]